jgi:Ran GTPase-activating protein (RanGAP) involved in mRNA processing and transport
MEYIAHFIKNNTVLKEINLSMCEIDDDGIIYFAKYLSKSSLEILDLSQNSIGDRGCKSLLSSIPSTLTDLLLADNQITESSLKIILNFLVNNRTLKKLTISNNPICSVEEGDSNDDENSIWQQLIKAAKQNTICEFE